ncbi:hypothetical protein TNCV_231751 [Trichonephila clavipes]|nr:hypothetical protein TNCV_231751 [Trichonephila clavipes]
MHSGFVRKRTRICSTHQQTGNTDIPVRKRAQLRFAKQVEFLLAEGRLFSNVFIVSFKDIGRRSVGKSGWTNEEPITSPPRRDAVGEFSVFRHPSTHYFDWRDVHLQESAFRDNYASPRHSASGSHTTSRNRGFQRNNRNDNLNFRGESRI